MKAITLYSSEEIYFRKLLKKLEDYGQPNFDDLETFLKLYKEWHMENFPGVTVSAITATFREDWFKSFVDFLANKDL